MIPSQVLAAGNSPLSVAAIAGAGGNVTALGTNQATAAQLPASQNFIGPSAAGTGVKLPPWEQGAEVWIYNNSTQTIAIFPFELAGTTFNGGGVVSSILNAKCLCLKAFPGQAWMTLLTA